MEKGWKQFSFLIVGYFVFSMFRLSLGVALPSIMIDVKIDEVMAGWLYSSQIWLIAILVTPFGVLADRVGRKRLLIIGYLLSSLNIVLFSLSADYFGLLITLIFVGISAALLIPSYYSLVGEGIKGKRGLSVGLANSAFHIGGFMGSVLVGILISVYGWRSAYLSLGLLLLLATLVQYKYVKDGGLENSRNSKLMNLNLFKNTKIIISAMISLFGSIGFLAINAWLPTFLISNGFDIVDAGLILGSLMLMGAISAPTIGIISDKIGRRNVMLLINLTSALLALSLFSIKQLSWIPIAYSLALGFLIAPYWNLSIAIAQESVEKGYETSATGIVQTFGYLGNAIGPAAAGILIASHGLNLGLIYITIIPFLICSLLSLKIGK